MKIDRLLLRWYKSFNINYRREAPSKSSNLPTPWNRLHVGDKLQEHFPFIEIPIESDITTIVGANESGKSHLLSAVAKVLTGKGIDGRDFQQTDLCRYATMPASIASSKRWANIGLRITSSDEGGDITGALRAAGITDAAKAEAIAIVLGDPDPSIGAHVFIDENPTARKISPEQLAKMREVLPRVEFINASAALPDNLTYDELAKCLGNAEDGPSLRYGLAVAQDAASFLSKLELNSKTQPSEDLIKNLNAIRRRLEAERADVSEDARLAGLLLTEVLGLDAESILKILSLPSSDRGFIDYHVNGWNRSIAERLNLRRFWRQDDQAALTLRYREGILYFDITDKTGATYTFKERSSGLRYFLSYYIQAKAMEVSQRNRNAVVLMDEPDSFLSILGQRNLLSVFESLVSFESSAQTSQLLYTTHSPFLINQNFPRRVRVVTKEESEEGTQYQGRSSARRYEPVRSALGINCAQTLFMGATNLVLEGPTDQYLLTEVVRFKSKPDAVSEWLDLNAIAVVSADGVDNVEKVLTASQWGDEPIPATVVLIDSDRPDVKERITGRAKGAKKLVESEFALTLADVLGNSVITIEDLVPWRLYAEGLRCYVERWHRVVYEQKAATIREQWLRKPTDQLGNAERAKKLMCELLGGANALDKLGVLTEVVRIASAEKTELPDEVGQLSSNVQTLCRTLSAKLVLSRQQASQKSVASTLKRLVREFLLSREHGSSLVDVEDLLGRLDREARQVEDASVELRKVLSDLNARLSSILQTGQTRFTGEDWRVWQEQLELIKRSPLTPMNIVTPTGRNPQGIASVGTPSEAVRPNVDRDLPVSSGAGVVAPVSNSSAG